MQKYYWLLQLFFLLGTKGITTSLQFRLEVTQEGIELWQLGSQRLRKTVGEVDL